MRHLTKILALSLILGCGGSAKPGPAAPAQAEQTAREGLQIRLTTIYVDDQEKALRFYTDVLGFARKDDETNGSYRWITVTSASDPNSTELHLALNDDPAAKAFQQAQYQNNHPAIMFYTDDITADYERIKARGGEFTSPPTEVMPGSTIATLKDNCGNFIQLTQLDR